MQLGRRDRLAHLLAKRARQRVQQDRVVVAANVERVRKRDLGRRVVLFDKGAVQFLAREREDRNLLRLGVVEELFVLIPVEVDRDRRHAEDRLGDADQVGRELVGTVRDRDATCVAATASAPREREAV